MKKEIKCVSFMFSILTITISILRASPSKTHKSTNSKIKLTRSKMANKKTTLRKIKIDGKKNDFYSYKNSNKKINPSRNEKLKIYKKLIIQRMNKIEKRMRIK